MAEKMAMAGEVMYLLACHGYLPAEWDVLYDLPHTLIIRKKDRSDAAVIYKD